MHEFLFQYQRVPPTTWVYLSSLMTIALYFKFGRLWSVRNLDLVGLILLAPGLLMVEYGRSNVGLGVENAASIERLGYVWLFVFGAALMVRLLADPTMVRRPLLEPNLSPGGLTFCCAALLVFLMANVLTSRPTEDDLAGAQAADRLRARQQADVEHNSLASRGPGYPLLFFLPSISTQTLLSDDAAEQAGTEQPREERRREAHYATARTVAILSHLAIVICVVMIGYRHFDNIKTGIAAATLYLLLPYTALHTGRVDHVLPGALLVGAVVAYRRPLASGMLMGLAIGVIYYPAFLLPLWISFYWKRGLMRFVSGVVSMILLLVCTLAFTSADMAMFLAQVKQMFGWRVPTMEPEGLWHYTVSVYRIPVLTAFAALCTSFAIWPAQKNLGTLMSCSAAVMLGTQFWHAHGGGLYMAWYLPLALLTVFRPNLEDRVALSVLGEARMPNFRTPGFLRWQRAA